jgi:hypothetical protein
LTVQRCCLSKVLGIRRKSRGGVRGKTTKTDSSSRRRRRRCRYRRSRNGNRCNLLVLLIEVVLVLRGWFQQLFLVGTTGSLVNGPSLWLRLVG